MGRGEKKARRKVLTRIEKLEREAKAGVAAVWVGLAVGIIGFFLTAFIDVIRTQPMEFEWLQVGGALAFLGLALFSGLMLGLMKG